MPTDWSVVDEPAVGPHPHCWEMYDVPLAGRYEARCHRCGIRETDVPPTPARIPTVAIVVALLAGLFALVLGRVVRRLL